MPWIDNLPLFNSDSVAVPYASGSETSKAGAVHIAPHAGTQMAIVLDRIRSHGPVSDTEIAQLTDFGINVVTARRRRLELDGLIEQAGTKKSTAGVLNKVWVIRRT
jgi:transcription initiation factor IIE alpha subunit